jgi:hypothetical protein
MRAPAEVKSVDKKDSLYKELEHVFDEVQKYHINFWWEISVQK